MNYQETIQYLYNSAPLFQQIGGAAYKEGLDNTLTLDEHFGHPHRSFATVHVAGTNGKGSCSHMLAAILQAAGYKVGLYTSPHLVDFRERIRINGEMIPEEEVCRFVETERAFFEPLHPSFFELTTALAFQYFASQKVDIAVIEVGLGGRLDCTNIIRPELAVITNISKDHTQFLGNTLAAIASEKAGIIKPHTPVVVGETTVETRPVFQAKAEEMQAPIIFAEDEPEVLHSSLTDHLTRSFHTRSFGALECDLQGDYQVKNMNTVLHAVKLLAGKWFPQGKALRDLLHEALPQVMHRTGLAGRWQCVAQHPTVVCDTGHNLGGWLWLSRQLEETPHAHLHIVFGMCEDKDVDAVLALLPREANYYFTQASVRRALDADALRQRAASAGLCGQSFPQVVDAFRAAKEQAGREDLIFIGGSSFVVADFFTARQKLQTRQADF